MRPVREITTEEENFRAEGAGSVKFIKRDLVKPEPEGTIILCAFRISGYDQDCDGSLMARLECINKDGSTSGGKMTNIGLYPEGHLVSCEEELQELFDGKRGMIIDYNRHSINCVGFNI